MYGIQNEFSNRNRTTMDIDTGSTVEVIDLCTPNMDMEEEPISYESEPDNTSYLSILACYPKRNEQDPTMPLLPNTPRMYFHRLNLNSIFDILANQLNQNDLLRRQRGSLISSFEIKDNNPSVPSFLREKYHMLFSDLIQRLKVDMTLLDYNYTRLNKYIRMFAYEQIRVFNLRLNEIPCIDEQEYPLALEFFLQFDRMIS